jgi:hypothetical protein
MRKSDSLSLRLMGHGLLSRELTRALFLSLVFGPPQGSCWPNAFWTTERQGGARNERPEQMPS